MKRRLCNTSRHMETTQPQIKGRWTGFIIGIVILVVIVVIALIANNSEKKEKNTEEVVSGTATQKMEPYSVGAFTYQFEDISWVFDKSDEEKVGVPLTEVKVWLDKFSRHNQAVVKFENPYKLGIYRGDCSEVDQLEFDVTTEARPLAYAQCTWEAEIADIAVFQDAQTIHFKKRISGADQFELLYSIDITEIVK